MRALSKTAGGLLIAAALVAGPVAAEADDSAAGSAAPQPDGFIAGSFLVRIRAIGVVPDTRSTISDIGGSVEATNTAVPEADFSYFVTKSISFELIAAVTKHDVTAQKTALGDVNLGSAWLLPPTLTAQYHFTVGGVIPYVGAGINYTHFFSIGLPKTGPVTAMNYGDSVGPALQIGADVPIKGRWYANLDLKKVWIESDVKVNGAIGASVHLDPRIIGGGIGYRF